jgi:hypothetical protein
LPAPWLSRPSSVEEGTIVKADYDELRDEIKLMQNTRDEIKRNLEQMFERQWQLISEHKKQRGAKNSASEYAGGVTKVIEIDNFKVTKESDQAMKQLKLIVEMCEVTEIKISRKLAKASNFEKQVVRSNYSDCCTLEKNVNQPNAILVLQVTTRVNFPILMEEILEYGLKWR